MSLNQKSKKNNPQGHAERPKKPKSKVTEQVNLDQLRSAPETLNQEDVLQAQKKVGNQAVQRSLSPNVNDRSITDEQGYLSEEISDQIQSSRGSGSALPPDLQTESKEKLGHDFDDVRIHTDKTADELSQKINAKAFTIGKDIYFKEGEYKPDSPKGRETLLHELTHVVQQSGVSQSDSRLKLGETDTVHEKEAEKLGMQGAEAGQLTQNSVGETVQRTNGEDEEEVPIAPPMPGEEQLTELEQKRREMGIGSTKHMAKLGQIDTDLESRRQETIAEMPKSEERGALLEKINDPNTSEEEVQSLTQQLNTVYGGKTNTFKEFFGAGMGSEAKDERRKRLKEMAQRGDEGAYEKLQAFDKANPSKWSKFKSFVSSSAKSAYNFASENKGVLGSIGGAIGGLFGLGGGSGDKKKESAPAPKPAGVSINMGGAGGGGGGIATIMQEYARLVEENKRLEEQLKQAGETPKKDDDAGE